MYRLFTIILIAALLTSCSATQKSQKAMMWGAIAAVGVAIAAGSSSGKGFKAKASNSINGTIDNGTLKLSTSARHAGAICSLVWIGKEFIDCHDHGRLLQSAVSFDGLSEAFNPTEGGGEIESRRSILQGMNVTGNVLSTTTQMAYWREVNGVGLSDHILHKRVELGYNGLDNVIQYDVQYDMPNNRVHHHGVFEFLTGYYPRDFDTFYSYSSGSLSPKPITARDFNTEQPQPIIASTSDGRYAIALWSPDLPQGNLGNGGFLLQGDVPGIPKANLVRRAQDPSGSYRFRAFVIIGSLEQVRTTMIRMNIR